MPITRRHSGVVEDTVIEARNTLCGSVSRGTVEQEEEEAENVLVRTEENA